MKRKGIDVNLYEFHCELCGTITKRVDRHQGYFWFDSGNVLPTAPMKVLLDHLCPECFKELKEQQQKLENQDTFAAQPQTDAATESSQTDRQRR